MFLIDKIDPLYFFVSLCIGLLITYCFTPQPNIVIKYPTPENSGKIVYRDKSDNCYKFISNEVNCPKDKSKINEIPINK